MREPPQLAHSAIVAALEDHYRVCVTALAFLPLGMDSDSAAYRVQEAGGMAYFLKVRSGHGFSPSSLAMPHYLHQRGLPHILAPLPTISGDLWAHAGGFAISLYPYIDGRTGADVGMSAGNWRALGALVRQIHDAGLPPEIPALLRGEAFVPSRRQVLARLQGAIACHNLTDPAQAELAAFWRSLQQTIDTVVDRADALGPQLRQASLPRVLCHADLHAWNVLVDADGQAVRLAACQGRHQTLFRCHLRAPFLSLTRKPTGTKPIRPAGSASAAGAPGAPGAAARPTPAYPVKLHQSGGLFNTREPKSP